MFESIRRGENQIEVEVIKRGKNKGPRPPVVASTALHTMTEKELDKVLLVEPVVGPNGEFVEASINHNLKTHGLALVVIAQGQLVLSHHARARGFVFYRDMCMGALPGVEPSPLHWKLYLAVRKNRSGGKLPGRGTLTPEQLYHPEVIRRRKGHRDGVEFMDQAAVDEMIAKAREEFEGGLSDDERSRLEARARELGMDVDVDDSDAGAILDEIEGKPKRGKGKG